MAQPNYPDALWRLLGLWELHLAKLELPRVNTRRRAPSCAMVAAIAAHEPDVRLTKSQLTKAEYLRQRVARAIAPLATFLDESDLRFISIKLEESLRTNPHLARLVERATRSLP